MTTEQPSITCPRCRRTSYNPNDIESKYCGNHQYHHLLADGVTQLVCARCKATLGFEVPPGMEVEAGREYPVREVDVWCAGHAVSDRR